MSNNWNWRPALLLSMLFGLPLPAVAQGPWTVTGAAGISSAVSDLGFDGPTLGSVAGQLSLARAVGAGTTVGLEVGYFRFGKFADARIGNTSTDFFDSSAWQIGAVLRSGGAVESSSLYFVGDIGVYRVIDDFEQGPNRTFTGPGAGVGLGARMPVSTRMSLGLEGRLHGLVGGQGDSVGTLAFVTLMGTATIR